MGSGCGHLRIVYLTGCDKLTDAGISALGVGCGQLQRINLAGRRLVTDVGISVLNVGCGQLQSISLDYWRHIGIGCRMWSAAEH